MRCVKDKTGAILGLVGVHDTKLEMLFLLAQARRKGIGKLLLNYAIDKLGAVSVDVTKGSVHNSVSFQYNNQNRNDT